jgi:hypothetical protein
MVRKRTPRDRARVLERQLAALCLGEPPTFVECRHAVLVYRGDL